jgi:hypothetical protein
VTTITDPPAYDSPPDIDNLLWAVVSAARDHADRMRITPNWQERLTREARRVVEAVEALEQAEAAR